MKAILRLTQAQRNLVKMDKSTGHSSLGFKSFRRWPVVPVSDLLRLRHVLEPHV